MVPARENSLRWAAYLLAAIVGAALTALPVLADTVYLKDGSSHVGTVVSLDAERLLLRERSGRDSVFQRSRIEKILLGEDVVSMRVLARITAADESADLLVNGETVILQAGRRGSEWVNLDPFLEDGNNEIRIRVHNSVGPWAYRFQVRINDDVEAFDCGQPGVRGRPCRCCGLTGVEIGLIDTIDSVWLNVDRESGIADIVSR